MICLTLSICLYAKSGTQTMSNPITDYPAETNQWMALLEDPAWHAAVVREVLRIEDWVAIGMAAAQVQQVMDVV
jgi:hypothetical protein